MVSQDDYSTVKISVLITLTFFTSLFRPFDNKTASSILFFFK